MYTLPSFHISDTPMTPDHPDGVRNDFNPFNTEWLNTKCSYHIIYMTLVLYCCTKNP